MVKDIGAPMAQSKQDPKGEQAPAMPAQPRIKTTVKAIQANTIEGYEKQLQEVMDMTDGVDIILNRLGEMQRKDGLYFNQALILEKLEDKQKTKKD